MQRYSIIRRIYLTIALCGSCLLSSNVLSIGSMEENSAIAHELTTLYRSARAVISKNQSHINDSNLGDKGLSGEYVMEEAKKNYAATTGSEFSLANASEETTLKRYPLTAHTKARDEPVLPPVYSTTVMPGLRSPLFSASSIMARAIRSL